MRFILRFTPLFIAFLLPSDARLQEESPDMLARVNRRPGILEAPSDVPTGDQADLYVNLDQIPDAEKPAPIEDQDGSQEE